MKLLSVCLLGLLMFINCQDKETKALELYNQAQGFERRGRLLMAYALYDSLSQYEGTKSYTNAKANLLKKGISIGRCLTSWTILEMTRIENHIVGCYRENRDLPNFKSYENRRDAWGNAYQFMAHPKPEALFQIRSLGPDAVEGTKDDLLMVYHEKKLEEKEELKMGLDDFLNLKKNHKDNNSQSSLHEFNNLNNESTAIMEKQVALEDLISEQKRQN